MDEVRQVNGPRAATAPAGWSGAALAERVRRLVEASVPADGPGVAVLVLADGQPIHAAGRGLADLQRRAPFTPSTLVDLASVSKQFTAMALLILHERGQLSLDDDVRVHLPELPAPPGPRPVRLTDLLGHASGLPDYLDHLSDEDLLTLRNADIPELIHNLPFDFPPGTAHEYSNTSYALLPLVIERAAEVPFARFLHEELFVPLGMSSTRVIDSLQDDLTGRARGYTGEASHYRLCEQPNVIAGDGGVWSNLDDVRTWMQGLLDNRAGLVETATWGRMFTSGTLGGEETFYGLGMRVQSFRGQAVFGHGGRWAGYSHYAGFYAGGRLGIAVLGNLRCRDAEGLADALADDLIDDLGTRRGP
jgi:CubicO group peptidase (beta-lactamase class C family)